MSVKLASGDKIVDEKDLFDYDFEKYKKFGGVLGRELYSYVILMLQDRKVQLYSDFYRRRDLEDQLVMNGNDLFEVSTMPYDLGTVYAVFTNYLLEKDSRVRNHYLSSLGVDRERFRRQKLNKNELESVLRELNALML